MAAIATLSTATQSAAMKTANPNNGRQLALSARGRGLLVKLSFQLKSVSFAHRSAAPPQTQLPPAGPCRRPATARCWRRHCCALRRRNPNSAPYSHVSRRDGTHETTTGAQAASPAAARGVLLTADQVSPRAQPVLPRAVRRPPHAFPAVFFVAAHFPHFCFVLRTVFERLHLQN
jgi:hypothetical protein